MNKNIKHIQKHFDNFLENCKDEQDDYKKVNEILYRYIKDKNNVSKWELEFIRLKFQDYLKIAASGVIFVLPAGSILLPILIKYSKNLGIDIRPSSFKK